MCGTIDSWSPQKQYVIQYHFISISWPKKIPLKHIPNTCTTNHSQLAAGLPNQPDHAKCHCNRIYKSNKQLYVCFHLCTTLITHQELAAICCGCLTWIFCRFVSRPSHWLVFELVQYAKNKGGGPGSFHHGMWMTSMSTYGGGGACSQQK